jgi:hypothetical protein
MVACAPPPEVSVSETPNDLIRLVTRPSDSGVYLYKDIENCNLVYYAISYQSSVSIDVVPMEDCF